MHDRRSVLHGDQGGAIHRRSFRGSGFNLFSTPIDGDPAQGGARFKPEIARDVEIGGKFSGSLAGAPVRGSIALYQEWIDNIQRITFVTIAGVPGEFTVNIPQAKVRGVELEGQINPARWLSLGASGTYTDSEFSKNQTTLFGVTKVYGPYPDAPKWSGSAFAEFSVPMGDQGTVSLRGDVYAQTSAWFSSLGETTLPGTKLPGYTLANFRLSFDDVLYKGVSVSANVRNAFNRTYYTGGLPLGEVLSLNTAIPGKPRTYYVEMKFKW